MAKSMFLMLFIVGIIVHADLTPQALFSVGKKCSRSRFFDITEAQVQPWRPTPNGVSEIMVSGEFLQEVFVEEGVLGIRRVGENNWDLSSTFVNSTYSLGEIADFYAYATWPKRKGFYTVTYNLVSDEILACWEADFFID